jgi:glycogen(starch) synthase
MMRIALISAEYAGAVHAGGIGTYMRNLADMLVARGHDVEVFASGVAKSHETTKANLRVNYVECHSRGQFATATLPVFSARHRAHPFDVAEGAEFMAETAEVSRAWPDLPLVLKLHTPTALMRVIDSKFLPFNAKARFVLGGLARGRIPKPYWRHDRDNDFEFENIASATVVTSPCRAMVDALVPLWGLASDNVDVVPNVFVPQQRLLEIAPETTTNTVTFIGRLEVRKGVIALARAIPYVVDRDPSVRFRFVGRSLPHPGRGIDMKSYLQGLLRGYESNVEFIDGVTHEQVLQYYAQTDICVFPSVWENFPNVCLEAMSAARGVIGSSAGGMAEMLEDGCGLLASPDRPREISESILALVVDPERRMRLGKQARKKVLAAYSWGAVGPQQEAVYARAINEKMAKRSSVRTVQQ